MLARLNLADDKMVVNSILKELTGNTTKANYKHEKIYIFKFKSFQLILQVEKMCFCSFFLCNGGAQSSRSPNLALTIIAATLVVAITASSKWDRTARYSKNISFTGLH